VPDYFRVGRIAGRIDFVTEAIRYHSTAGKLDDAISLRDGAGTMCNDQHGNSRILSFQIGQQLLLAVRIKRICCLVEYQ